MSRLTPEKRDQLVQDLAQMGSAGQAERESEQTFSHTFYPVVEHMKAFDPDVVLVIGDRGAGKSELFRAVVKERLLKDVVRLTPGQRVATLDLDRTTWLAGYPLGTDFPDAAQLRRLMPTLTDPHEVSEMWFAYLVRVLRDEIDLNGRQCLASLLAFQGGDVASIYGDFKQAASLALLALDRLEHQH